ncbi:MAG: UxaA family hydrolase [Anaerolineae bacterium]|nr:UxaA family hydrolase [Anaerolineae bacterium]
MTEFLGYVRPDGSVGIRNYVLLLSGTLYANKICDYISGIVPNTISITHPLGRCQVRPDLRMTRRFLSNSGMNPNIAAVVVVDHFREEGCTAEDIAGDIQQATGKPVATVNIRGSGGFVNAMSQALHYAADYARMVSDFRREPVPVSKLLMGVECGTSDTTSGLASNPSTGICSDLVIAEGGRTIMAECTEWMGCEHWLTSRAETPEIAAQIVAGVQDIERRAMASGEDIRGSQPTGDNIVGGLTTIEEKSMGAVKKGGSAPIVGYLEIAERPTSAKPGLYLMYGPGHGGESLSSMAAAGCQVLVFNTGGGHTSAHPIMPTIKITGNAHSFELMKDTVELDVSGVLRGEFTIEASGQRVFDEVIATCNGRLTKSETFGDLNSFAIHRVGISI